jgi:hypothetical protein
VQQVAGKEHLGPVENDVIDGCPALNNGDEVAEEALEAIHLEVL